MSRNRVIEDSSAAGAYVADRELHALVAPHLGEKAFRAAIRALEDQGFPKSKPLFRGRYWPAVKAWLDEYEGLKNDAGSQAEDGPEHFDAHEIKPPRLQIAASR